ncbi:hypothetical protein MICAF_950004 [Microcystis aeruginosa PCC 9807]|uniref:Uncharacterized protein n=1 Tax=Microcystis aeruginosa PCC 9807 TaxID=1160283 RepID=I4HF49_MICAE|nr:hypothetical protein MICAF_950004 [Microcystis aeruginosa PCC 9807]
MPPHLAYHQSQPRVSPDEKVFTPTDERGFLPYTPHPTPSFKSVF